MWGFKRWPVAAAGTADNRPAYVTHSAGIFPPTTNRCGLTPSIEGLRPARYMCTALSRLPMGGKLSYLDLLENASIEMVSIKSISQVRPFRYNPHAS